MIIGFGAAAGEDDFLGAGVDERGDLFAGSFDGGAGVLAEGVDGGGVAEFGGEIGEHGVEDGGVDGSGGVVIEVDTIHGSGRIRIEGMGAGRKQSAKIKKFNTEAQKGPQRSRGVDGDERAYPSQKKREGQDTREMGAGLRRPRPATFLEQVAWLRRGPLRRRPWASRSRDRT